jgi:hypothetical protein
MNCPNKYIELQTLTSLHFTTLNMISHNINRNVAARIIQISLHNTTLNIISHNINRNVAAQIIQKKDMRNELS